jgi:asparagine synthase (glutamine-hydrolysing)
MSEAGANGEQPPNWIVFNGEIYNYLDLQSELAKEGWPCQTRCDTEVILKSYRVWGDRCVHKLRGMFAWCLLDSGRGLAWFCRDRLGIKPLYLFTPFCGGFLFASELRALLAAGPELVPPHLNRAALESFFAQGAVCGRLNIVQGIQQLAAGESLISDWSGRIHKRVTYWQVPFCPDASGEGSSVIQPPRSVVQQRLGLTLREAVRIHLLADVPVGLFLSGGVDSTVLATVATELGGSQVETFTVGFDQVGYDETETAAKVAGELGCHHRTIRLTGAEVLEQMSDVLATVDQPTVDGFNVYFVSRLARRAGLKVALSGLGGDELFGGYATFRDVGRALWWRNWLDHLGPARNLARLLLNWTGGRRGSKASALLNRPPVPLQLYLLRRELFLPGDRRDLHPLPDESDPFSGLPGTLLAEIADQARGLDPINQVSLFELSVYMRYLLLRDADVFSMRHGLELRVPLLDHEIVEQVAALAGSCKRPDPRPKALLLDAAGDRVPMVGVRAKQGFTFPWGPWLRGPLRDRASRAVSSVDVWMSLEVQPRAPLALWNRFLRGDSRISPLQVVALIVLEDFTTRHGLRCIP